MEKAEKENEHKDRYSTWLKETLEAAQQATDEDVREMRRRVKELRENQLARAADPSPTKADTPTSQTPPREP